MLTININTNLRKCYFDECNTCIFCEESEFSVFCSITGKDVRNNCIEGTKNILCPITSVEES